MKTIMMIVLAMVMATGALYGEATGQAPPVPSEEEPEVLTRGPVNEAFAQPVNLDDQTGLIAPIAPPEDIDEVPPEDRPTGEQFAWVPGYWAWDSDRNAYIWVSGCWRAMPPKMYWIPGYWAKAEDGWQWTAGFWAPDGDDEIEYLPEPPAMTYVEPQESAQSPDKIWVPACWYWRHGQYIQRPGYWIVANDDWVWVPSHYVRTPRGYVFANGHWDYAIGRRGVLFAPVYFHSRTHARHRFSYRLSIVVDMGNLEFGMFTHPRYRHYYFGDYYDSAYIRIGIFPWYEWRHRHTWYDPIYVHDRWRNRHHKDYPQWEQHQRREYDRRRDDKKLRPPRTYREMERRVDKMPESKRRHFEIASPMTRVVTRKTTFKFEKTKPEDRSRISRHADDVHKYAKERSEWESRDTGRKDGRPGTQRVPSTKSEKITSPTKRNGPVVRPERTESTPKQRTPSAESKEMTPPTKRKGPVMRPSEHAESTPTERSRRVETPSRERSSTTLPEQQRQTKDSPRKSEPYQSDKVRVRTPPVSNNQGDSHSRSAPPSRPIEEEQRHNRK